MRTYLIISPASPIHKCFVYQLDRQNKARIGIKAFAEKHSLPIVGFYDNLSVAFEEGYDPGKNWRKLKMRDAWTPKQNTKVGKALYEEMEQLPQRPSWIYLLEEVRKASGKELDLMEVNSKGTIHFQQSPDKVNFFVICDEYWLPDNRDGIEEVSLPEYRKRFEELAKAAKAEGGK